MVILNRETERENMKSVYSVVYPDGVEVSCETYADANAAATLYGGVVFVYLAAA